jgi:hypothetical protein
MIAPFLYTPDVHEGGERACAPEPNDQIIWDGLIAVKRRRSDSFSADDVSTLFRAASILRRSVAMCRLWLSGLTSQSSAARAAERGESAAARMLGDGSDLRHLRQLPPS